MPTLVRRTQHHPRLWSRMALLGVRTKDLAAFVGVSEGHLHQIRQGTRNASPALRGRIADALECQVSDIFDEPAR